MIIYDLQCHNGHRFEGWFEDGETFESQCKQELIACPVCNDTAVVRVPSTFAIKSVKTAETQAPQLRSPAEAQIMARAVMSYMENNFDNVGTDFAKEALKIHYGATEPRNIRGVSTAQEEETLRKEGVEFFKVPMPDSDEKKSSSPPDAESEN